MCKPESGTHLQIKVCSSLGHGGKIPVTIVCSLSPSDLLTLAFLSVQWPNFNGQCEEQLYSGFAHAQQDLGVVGLGGDRHGCRLPISWTCALTNSVLEVALIIANCFSKGLWLNDIYSF